MIEFISTTPQVKVLIDSKFVGTIKINLDTGRWHYLPKGGKQTFKNTTPYPSLQACEESVRGDQL